MFKNISSKICCLAVNRKLNFLITYRLFFKKLFKCLSKNNQCQKIFSFVKKRKKLILAGSLLLGIFLFFYGIIQGSTLVIPGIAEIVVWKKEVGKTMLALALIPVLSFVFFELSELILMWVTTPEFLGLDFTLANPIINYGWTAVVTLVNMFFILILVVIAIGTALRIKEYEIKTLLPRFIAAVLLVNFGPAIFALIANASEVFVNHFLQEIGGLLHFISLLHSQFLIQMGYFSLKLVAVGLLLLIPGGWATVVAGLGIGATLWLHVDVIFFILFLIATGIIFLLFSFLLLARQFMIWILIVISPVAFLLWILPKTQPYARMWWNQFIGWCFVGIPAAFFLYLASILAVEIPPDVVSPMFRLLIVTVFLIVAFILIVKLTPIGGQAIMGIATGGLQKVTSKVVGSARRRTDLPPRLPPRTKDDKDKENKEGGDAADRLAARVEQSGPVSKADAFFSKSRPRRIFGQILKGGRIPSGEPQGRAPKKDFSGSPTEAVKKWKEQKVKKGIVED